MTKHQEWIEAVERAAVDAEDEANAERGTAYYYENSPSGGAKYLSRAKALDGDAASLTELAAYLRADGAEIERLRAMTSPEISDVEAEAALVAEGVATWGPDGEIFERMFAKVMETRAAINAAPKDANGEACDDESGSHD